MKSGEMPSNRPISPTDQQEIEKRLTLRLADDTHRELLEGWFVDQTFQAGTNQQPYMLEGWLNRYQRPGNFVWIAFDADQPIGFVAFQRAGQIGDIENLFVVRDKRGQGLGKGILRLLCRQPEVTRYRRLTTTVKLGNIPALRCFKAVGFTVREETDTVYELSRIRIR